jgi:hypothetical protein
VSNSTHRTRPLVTLGLAAVLALPLVGATAGDAAADVKIRVKAPKVRISAPNVRVRVRAGARAHGHVTPRVRVRRHRTHVTPRVRTRLHIGGHVSVGGSVYVGRTYATPPPPPPPPSYDCDVPAYYYDQPRPVRPVVVEPAPVVEPMGPRLGIGVFAGGVKTENAEADDVGLLARYRLTRGLAIEGELSRADSDYGETRRAGGALVWDLASHRALSPHLLAGLGGWDGNAYAEVGAGLTWRLTDSLHLALDLRAGAVDAADDMPVDGPIAACGGCTAPLPADDEPVSYTRGRLSALLWF